jgi:hypothetical protein
MPIWRPQFLDSSGNPLASGTVETYESGTSTPLATYSNEALSVSNGTTITLNAGGFPQVAGVEVGIWLLPRAYRFILKNSAGVTQRTIDGVYALQAAAAVNLEIDGVAGVALSAGEFAYLSDGSGGLTAGRWYKADADLSYASASAVLAYVPSAIAQGATGTLRIGGNADGLSGLVAGSTYYVSATGGQITATAPAAGYVRAVGVATSATVLTIAWSPRSGDLPLSPLNICEGRLTATTGVPVTTGDVSAATSIFYAPYVGNRIALYDGVASWRIRSFTQITISLSGLTASTPYDVFAYDNAGTVTIETVAWTNATTRATALTTQDGVYVKTGATTRRYLGTVYINASGAQTDDTVLKRYLWNYYHRAPRRLLRKETTSTWTYTTATIRQANGAAANKVEIVIGVDEVLVDMILVAQASSDTASVNAYAGIGIDSTTAFAAAGFKAYFDFNVANRRLSRTGIYRASPGVGYHTVTWLEVSEAAGVTTWGGATVAGPSTTDNGLTGSIEG